jgi:small subunit ribosomal protein S2
MIEDANAVREATKLQIPVIALCDTNTNPSLVTYPIPSNDDAVKAIQLACDYMVAAVEAGKAKQKTATPEAK